MARHVACPFACWEKDHEDHNHRSAEARCAASAARKRRKQTDNVGEDMEEAGCRRIDSRATIEAASVAAVPHVGKGCADPAVLRTFGNVRI